METRQGTEFKQQMIIFEQYLGIVSLRSFAHFES